MSEMTVILRTTLAADGAINEETHRRFWELVEQDFSVDATDPDLEFFAAQLSELILGMQGWQVEVWKVHGCQICKDLSLKRRD